MNMKKSLSVTTLGLAVLGFGFTNNASASEVGAADKQPVLVDFDTIQSTKTSNVSSLTVAAAPKNDSNISVYTPFFGNPYAVAQSKSTTTEDYIYAKARTFNGDGSLVNTKSNNAKKSSYVSATATNTSVYYGDDYAIGNHTYKLNGYNDVNHETKASW
ncbi:MULTISPECIES: XoxI protein [Bacillus cereus group]|uniref:XoxI protein n=1 Tax=Bacillus cereus group TaxID=86661 RepID=UPI000B4460BF|nr:XoxI protein [Bacillus toyonensis]OTX09825.1 XoxI protein [Bacillus thuringiensis serovar seoulensis]MCA1045810.1 XoxI protein [Bacillus toyonensis]MDO8161299.1 XoxI protein [Bacillus toyonensis]MED3197781.1 XoxI protein [Bacillus toyonensis]MED3539130.1 XoxI protein [Bacillus toyonensis]